MPENPLEVQGIVELDLDGSGESVTIVYLKTAHGTLGAKNEVSPTEKPGPQRLAWAV